MPLMVNKVGSGVNSGVFSRQQKKTILKNLSIKYRVIMNVLNETSLSYTISFFSLNTEN